MPLENSRSRKCYSAAAAFALAGSVAASSANAALSVISGITLYPGGATVERQITVPTGSTRLEVSCLPASFDPQSLRLLAPPNIQLGDFRIEDSANADQQSNERCATTARDKRVQDLQTQLAALNARAQAVELSAGYLKNVSEQTTDPGSKSSMLSTSRALEQSGYAVYAQRDQIKQQQEAVQSRLDAMRGDGPIPTRTIRIALDAPRGGVLKIAYDTPRAGWIAAYQANLDSLSGQIVLERRALVAQATGEDWHGVKLQLSTGSPVSNSGSPQLYTWQLRLLEPRPSNSGLALQAPAPPVLASVMQPRRPDTDSPLFAPTQIDGAFVTKFEIPGKIEVPSDAQKVGFTLASITLPARLVARLVPRQSTRAWLYATAAAPEGVWPDGKVQLLRDSAQVGETRWSDALQGDELSLPFGSDEQVFASKTDGADSTGTVKTLGGDASKTLSVRYTVKNRHRKPVDVEIVEAAPISESADIKVTSNFTPAPDDTSWQGRQDIVSWNRRLAAGEETTVGSSYIVRYPGNRTIIGLP
jgi:uncharacterized protein (TIGR02231 family)